MVDRRWVVRGEGWSEEGWNAVVLLDFGLEW